MARPRINRGKVMRIALRKEADERNAKTPNHLRRKNRKKNFLGK